MMILTGHAPANFAKVDQRVWRSARPTDVGQVAWLLAAAESNLTIINLEWEQGDAAMFAGTTAKLIRIKDFEPLPWFEPALADDHIVRALVAIRQASGVSLVHCRSGQNRTGVVIAAYRILERGDFLDGVLEDFKKYGGFWRWFDMGYIRSIDARRKDLLERVAIRARLPT